MRNNLSLRLLLADRDKEIERLKLDLEHANSQCAEYANRCLKALKYIESRNAILGDKVLMNILIGADKQ